MKKALCGALALVALLGVTGCEKVESYKEGTYEGSVVDSYNNEGNIATAKVVIDSDGKIKSVYLDTTYTVDGVETTKKTLGNDYNMQTYNPAASGEWFEQVEKLEKAIVENQGVDFLNLDEEGYTDAVSGCTIIIDALVAAVEDALDQAK